MLTKAQRNALMRIQVYEWVNNPSYEAIFEEYGVDGDMFAGGMESDATVSLS